MSENTVRVDWVANSTFLAHDRYGFPIVIAQPNGVDGADMLPLALISCAIWDVRAILVKQRQALTALSATAACEQDTDPPWRYRRIHVTYHLRGRLLDERKVARAVELSQTKYCAIYATLRDAVEIVTDWVIEEETQDQRTTP